MSSYLKHCDQLSVHHVVLLGDKYIRTHRLTLLKPYTKYNISVAMISTSNRMGPFSKSILVQTMEGSESNTKKIIVMICK